jgi:hypothetical protein
MTRLLLPFTSGVEMDVLDSLIRLASYQCATLIPLSLIPLPATKHKGVRLELIQQSKDFVEAVRYKAMRYQIPVEPAEIFTRDIAQSILTSVDQLHCNGILLASRETRGSLLNMDVIQQLLHANPCTLFVVYFPAKKRGTWVAQGLEHFAHWWSGERSNQEVQRNIAYETNTDYQLLMSVPYVKQTEQQEQPGSTNVIPRPMGDYTAVR